MTVTQNTMKKNHYYLHEVFAHTWAILSNLYSAEDLKEMGFQQDFDWSQPPSKKFKKVKVPDLLASSYSSSRESDEHEDLDDTTACPTSTTDPNNAGAPPSTQWWYSSGALVLTFHPFWAFDDKGREILS